MSPQLLVAATEEPGPEPERQARDDTSARNQLALLESLYRNDDLFDPIGLQDIEVEEPRASCVLVVRPRSR
jgi:hypothetical protein